MSWTRTNTCAAIESSLMMRVLVAATLWVSVGTFAACGDDTSPVSGSEDELLTPDFLQSQLGWVGNTTVVSLPGGTLTPSIPEATILGFSGPDSLRLGQPFALRLTTNYRNSLGARNVMIHVADATQGLIADALVAPSGQSEAGIWSLEVQGKVGLDGRLVGGPHMVELALLDADGRVGQLVPWRFYVVDGQSVACPGAADCGGRSCGRDAVCGLVCGSCEPGEACLAAGVCEPIHPDACPDAADCAGRSCGADPVCGTSCGAGCSEGLVCIAGGTCVPDPDADDGTTTGMQSQTSGSQTDETDTHDETETDTDPSDTVPCGDRECGIDPIWGVSCGQCEDGLQCVLGQCETCTPDCDGLECGVDRVCGQSCGVCDPTLVCDDGICECAEDCQGNRCGLDPVCHTGDCGSCSSGDRCESGTCVPDVCIKDCTDRACGPDPRCGQSCGTCPAGRRCDDGNCECAPDCSARVCGLDPVCGVSCGTCGAGKTCNAGACEDIPCMKQCSGIECGLDPVCGESCGTCGAGKNCQAGTCADIPCMKQCGGLACGPDPVCGQSCGTCGAGKTCQAGTCADIPCMKQCGALACGPDPVCGESCGSCGTNQTCNMGTCENLPCIPQCGARECGPDPVCGMECGPCTGGEQCKTSNSSCVGCLGDADCPGRLNLCGTDDECHLVQCIDDSDCTNPANPICGASNVCERCTQIVGQCPSNAVCDPFVGQCMFGHLRLSVKEGVSGCNDSNTGSSGSPLCTLREAITRANATTALGTTIFLSSVDGEVDGDLSMTGTGPVVIVGSGGVTIVGARTNNSNIRASIPLAIFEGVNIRGISPHCELVPGKTGGKMWFGHGLISTSGCGVAAPGSTAVRIEDSKIVAGGSWGVYAYPNSRIDLENTQLVIPPPATPGTWTVGCAGLPPVPLLGAADHQLASPPALAEVRGDYVTIVNAATVNPGSAFRCTTDCLINLNNSLIAGTVPDITNSCSSVTLTNTATTDASLVSGTVTLLNNVSLSDLFIAPTQSVPNVHLRPAGQGKVVQVKSIALQSATSPTTDIDDQPRVAVGVRDYPGADKP